MFSALCKKFKKKGNRAVQGMWQGLIFMSDYRTAESSFEIIKSMQKKLVLSNEALCQYQI